MSDEWGDDEYFTSTPAPFSAPEDDDTGPTSVPAALRPIDPKTAQFDSDRIETQQTAAEIMAEQARDRSAAVDEDVEYDGPTPTGKGVSDLADTVGLPPSLGALFGDMQEAILGIAGDLMGSSTERESLADILTYNNRLRGLGSMCVIIAVVGLMLDAFAESEKTSSLVEQLMATVAK